MGLVFATCKEIFEGRILTKSARLSGQRTTQDVWQAHTTGLCGCGRQSQTLAVPDFMLGILRIRGRGNNWRTHAATPTHRVVWDVKQVG